MYTILEKDMLTPTICRMKVSAPRIAEAAKPGQFLIVIDNPKGERIPLTISDYDAAAGTVDIVTQSVGASTMKIVAKNPGDSFSDVVGPLGKHSDFLDLAPEELKNLSFVFIAGGVGTAPLLHYGEELRRMDHEPTYLLGGRSAGDLMQLDLFEKSGRVFITTEDGTLGEKGYVTNHSLLAQEKFDGIATCGPKPMMVAVARYAHSQGTPCEASLENLMACGLGACLCCVEKTTEGHNVCVCKEGPVFNTELLPWLS